MRPLAGISLTFDFVSLRSYQYISSAKCARCDLQCTFSLMYLFSMGSYLYLLPIMLVYDIPEQAFVLQISLRLYIFVVDSASYLNCYLNIIFTANCSIGTYLNETANICTPCPLDSFSDQVWMLQCTACPDDWTTNSTGSTSMNDCSEFLYI